MSDLRELYQEIILDHNRNPRNHHQMHDATVKADGHNPLCGDKLTVYLSLNGEQVDDVSFLGCGCAISQASASLMTEAVKGKTLNEVHRLFETFQTMVTKDTADVPAGLDKLTVLAGVREFPMRVKCATLAWHTLEAAIKQDNTVAKTE